VRLSPDVTDMSWCERPGVNPRVLSKPSQRWGRSLQRLRLARVAQIDVVLALEATRIEVGRRAMSRT
jgi:hypothetical protein